MIGCAFHAPRNHDTASLEEAVHQATHNALRDAGLAINDIDGIVVAANDQYDGRAISIMAASGSVGGVGRDILCTPSCAEHAFVLAALRVGAGQFRTQQIGRASCRERVCRYVLITWVAVYYKKKKQ